jgi:hypothetical protein
MSWLRLLGLAPVCGPLSQRTFGRGNDPALGLASCRVSGHDFAVHHERARPRISRSPASGDPRPALRCAALRALSNPLMGLRRPSQQKCDRHEICALGGVTSLFGARARSCRPANDVAGPFSVLMGLMPGSTRLTFRVNRASSLSEVLHRP